MYKVRFAVIIALAFCFASPCFSQPSTASKLQEWKRGVWLSSGGGYAVWTDTHYFVVWGSGEGAKAQVYCGSSRVRYTDKGIARHQNLRIRKTPSSELRIKDDYSMYPESENGGVVEAPLEIDMSNFSPGVCNIVEGVIYDSVTEETPEYILLSSCNGDEIQLFSDGRYLYKSSDGSETWSYRIETW